MVATEGAGTLAGSSSAVAEGAVAEDAVAPGAIAQTAILNVVVLERIDLLTLQAPTLTIEHFRTWGDTNQWHGNYRQHTSALKWLRHVNVYGDPAAGGDPQQYQRLRRSGTQIATLVHDAKGMNYHFDTGFMRQWSWVEMIAQMDEPSMEYVVIGEHRRSGGVRFCEFVPRPNSYDIKRTAKCGRRAHPTTARRW